MADATKGHQLVVTCVFRLVNHIQFSFRREAGELLWGLRSDSLDVALEDEEVLRLDEDVVLDEGGVVRGVGHVPVVELILGRAGGRDSALRCGQTRILD